MTVAANGPNPLMATRSAEARAARMAIRRDLNSGALTLGDVLADPAPCIETMALFTLASWRRGWGKDRLRRLGRQAITDRINLAVTVGSAGRHSLDWLIEQDTLTARYPRRAA